jgi:transcriptional regulator with XRE-family HTH domain
VVKKSPNPIDKHVGSRVRMRRMMLSMNQEKLGDALCLTFQQVQKYEKGTNRIGASRLQHIAQILQVPVAFFFEGAPGQSKAKGIAPSPAYVSDFLAIRQAAIPDVDATMNRQYTPLQCVERVFGIEILANTPTKNWSPIRVDLDVKGMGRWQHELSVRVPQEPIRRPSIDDLLAGPSNL